jgi:hypothetical protein
MDVRRGDVAGLNKAVCCESCVQSLSGCGHGSVSGRHLRVDAVNRQLRAAKPQHVRAEAELRLNGGRQREKAEPEHGDGLTRRLNVPTTR